MFREFGVWLIVGFLCRSKSGDKCPEEARIVARRITLCY